MFSLSQRLQNVSNQALTFSFFIIGFIVASSWYQLYRDDAFNTPGAVQALGANLNMRTSRYYGSNQGKPKQNAKVNFDLDVDLSSLFNWNTKQVFIYLTAEYDGSKKPNTKSVVTFWDKIITSKKDAVLKLSNQKSKYTVWDLEDKMEGRDLTFKLQWNIQPWVGPLVFGETIGNTTFTIPIEEKKVKENENDSNTSADESNGTNKPKRKKRKAKARSNSV
ncbi:hypothetical protein Kpol_1023p16 [Vanderwaltozyma polyspora DSM 70294]|uniref:Signal peptidase subunit 3 n=1 Tax=Vanderwaltozyma polyspora (strain ATCC 22028 / DSM 70294 / BCRC 21397 / CBS 2163 / NBRC 10782 / NRRL Y-8283 / UCD 57-17) TaxID=436907 RepID=A7TFN9_VANPO|nr:uncharacterized protein Kpol_1023p16 [Vanderwaltozyma polyspora DSM 70294]EDO18847.1 hypothetical protein Kpol_1023p16 [Vanderwaltozyma polyspora DSM 70294]